MKKTFKKVLSGVLSLAMVLSAVVVSPGENSAQAASLKYDTFTLYVKHESISDGYDALCMDAWGGGLTFVGSTDNTIFSWNKDIAMLEPVADNTGWYSTKIKIGSDANAGAGLDIYEYLQNDRTNVNNKNKIAAISGSNMEVLITGDYSAYAWSDGTLHTSLKDAGLVLPEITKKELQELIDMVPKDVSEGAYTEASKQKLLTALANAEACVSSDTATADEIAEYYEALEKALANLRLSAKIYVEPIDGIEEDSIRGMDVSSYISIMDSFDELNENAGEIKFGFRDYDGKILSRQGFFDLLAAQGVNYIRLRVWNDPYDESGMGYGGGNNDVKKAVEMGQYATKAGMKVLIDFHYSDFWADPGKQEEPKEWTGKQIAEKAALISEFTEESLTELLKAGVDVGMVQVGNETNGALCGVTGSSEWKNDLDILFDAGCDAVHKVAEDNNTEILAAVHFTNPEVSGKQAGYAAQLANYTDAEGVKGVSYDVFATSYYPYWHGSLDNLNAVLSSIADKYDKYVMVAETSYANTLLDTDGHENTVRKGSNDTDENLIWQFTEQGQANEFRDVLEQIVTIKKDGETKGLGVFYWEGAWITLQDVNVEDQAEASAILEENKRLWEKYGSGWAASYASGYDPKDAGKYYGGSAVDNQAFFGADGTALSSLEVFNYDYLSKGAATEKLLVDTYTEPTCTIEVGGTISIEALSETVDMIFNNGEFAAAPVTWSGDDIAEVNEKAKKYAGMGNHVINGTATWEGENYPVTCSVEVTRKTSESFLSDYSFEKYNSGAWENWTTTAVKEDDSEASGFIWPESSDNNSRTGSSHAHFWTGSDVVKFTVSQDVTVTEPGDYRASFYAQGENANVSVEIQIGGNTIGKSQTEELTGWMNWITPVLNVEITQDMLDQTGGTVTFRICGESQPGGWGAIDDAYFYQAKTYKATVNSGTADAAEYEPGDLVTITADEAPEGMVFDEWIVDEGEIELKDATAQETTFRMEEGDAEVTATYKEKPAEPEETPEPDPENSPTPDPGSSPTPDPGSSPTPDPGSSPTPGPGSTTQPGSGSTTQPGSGTSPTPGPGTSSTPGPGTSPTPEPENTTQPGPGQSADPVVSPEPSPETSSSPAPEQPEVSEIPSQTVPAVGDKLKDAASEANYVVTKSASADGSTTGTVQYQPPTDKVQKKVTIPATVTIDGLTYKVTAIAANAFNGNKKITEIKIGANIKTIGNNAFKNCKKLNKVTVGKSVTKIGNNAFAKCDVLKSLVIPATVNKIGKGAFKEDKKLKSITIKTTKLTNKNVGKKAFMGINAKATIKVPKSKLTAYKALLKKKGVGSKATFKK